MRFPIAATACALAASLACASSAQAYAAQASVSRYIDYWSNSGWYVGDYSNDAGPSCGLGTEDRIEGRNPLITFIFMGPNTPFMVFQNSDWSITDGEHYPGMAIGFFDQNNQITSNYAGTDFIGGKESRLVVKIGDDFYDHVSRNRTMTAFRTVAENEPVVVGHVDLRGSSEAVGKLRECYQKASERHQSAVERERSHPKDPFAR